MSHFDPNCPQAGCCSVAARLLLRTPCVRKLPVPAELPLHMVQSESFWPLVSMSPWDGGERSSSFLGAWHHFKAYDPIHIPMNCAPCGALSLLESPVLDSVRYLGL
eukprot:s156_g11.t3